MKTCPVAMFALNTPELVAPARCGCLDGMHVDHATCAIRSMANGRCSCDCRHYQQRQIGTMSSDPLVLANAAYVDEDFEAALQHYSDVSGRSGLWSICCHLEPLHHSSLNINSDPVMLLL